MSLRNTFIQFRMGTLNKLFWMPRRASCRPNRKRAADPPFKVENAAVAGRRGIKRGSASRRTSVNVRPVGLDAHYFAPLNHICWSARAAEIGNSSAITGYGPCLHLQTGCVQQGDVGGHAVAVLCNRSPTPTRLMPTEPIRVKNVPCNQPRTSAILSKF